MRRRLGRMIPIFAVALLVQLLSPIAAFRFVASAIADPLSSIHFCSAMASTADAGETGPAGSPHDGACRAICAVGFGGAPTPASAPQDFVLVERFAQRLVWSLAGQAPPVSRDGLNARARAPPPDAAA